MFGVATPYRRGAGVPLMRGRGPYGVAAWLFLWLSLCTTVATEFVNSAREFASAAPPRRFPHNYVSKGIWTGYAWGRPPHCRSGDFGPPLLAASRIWQGDAALYAEFDGAGCDYVYPPTAAVVLLPFVPFLRDGDPGRAIQLMDVLNRLAALVLLILTLGVLRSAGWGWGQLLLWTLLVLMYFPLRWAVFCVNVQGQNNVLLALAAVAYAGRRFGWCGLALGLAICLKPHYSLLIVFFWLRGARRPAVASMAVVGAFAAISLVAVGPSPWVAYTTDVMPLMSEGYATWGNQTLPAAARRWFGDRHEMVLTPMEPTTRIISLGLSITAVVAACWPRWTTAAKALVQGGWEMERERHLRLVDFGLAALLITLASPIAWDHHYGWTPILFAGSLALAARVSLPRAWFWVMGIAFALFAADWVPVAASRGGWVSLLDSTDVLAALLLAACAWIVGARLWIPRPRSDGLCSPRWAGSGPSRGRSLTKGGSSDHLALVRGWVLASSRAVRAANR